MAKGEKVLYWRGSVSDLVTDLKDIIDEKQIQQLVTQLDTRVEGLESLLAIKLLSAKAKKAKSALDRCGIEASDMGNGEIYYSYTERLEGGRSYGHYPTPLDAMLAAQLIKEMENDVGGPVSFDQKVMDGAIEAIKKTLMS